ncbi:MAG: hypothetical protein LBF50_10160 [Azoarcus sp.]|jgi:ABC-type transporter lipoprotein component MlaA|nr:hypothetical protein [Azoarcus sp.]
MCTAGDAACLKDYPRGVFRFNDGVGLDPYTRKPLAHGRRIAPVSMRERAAASREQHDRHRQIR